MVEKMGKLERLAFALLQLEDAVRAMGDGCAIKQVVIDDAVPSTVRNFELAVKSDRDAYKYVALNLGSLECGWAKIDTGIKVAGVTVISANTRKG